MSPVMAGTMIPVLLIANITAFLPLRCRRRRTPELPAGHFILLTLPLANVLKAPVALPQ